MKIELGKLYLCDSGEQRLWLMYVTDVSGYVKTGLCKFDDGNGLSRGGARDDWIVAEVSVPNTFVCISDSMCDKSIGAHTYTCDYVNELRGHPRG